MSDTIAFTAASIYGIVFFLVCFFDIVYYRIPNVLALSICVLFPFAAVFASLDPMSWFYHAIGFILAAVAGVMAWNARLMGGGDIKLLAALGLWAGVVHLPFLLLVIALAGGGWALFLVILRFGAGRLATSPAGLPAVLQHDAPVPYGVPIAVGGVCVMPRLPLFEMYLGTF